jgi:uncharacterized protein YegJ (DUF2314 family)
MDMYRSLQLRILLVVYLAFVSACSPSLEGTPITEEEFNAAVEEAHSTMDTLREALLAPKASYDFVGIKVRFVSEEAVEDHWTEPVDYFSGNFTIRILDGILIAHGLNTESIVTVPEETVLDWVIIEDDGRMLGGYTIRLTYEHMTKEEKEKFLDVTGYKID